MGVLQKEFDRITQELCTNDSLRETLMRHVAEARGLNLTGEQIKALAKAIDDESNRDEVAIELEGDSEDIEITHEDLEAALQLLEKDMEERTEKAVLAALDELPQGVLDTSSFVL